MSEIPSTVGRYQVKRLIASGAMGEVFEAYDPIIDRPVALKRLHRELTERTDAVGWLERFRHEARAAGRRIHPNIVTILDFGEEDGAPFLAMEYVDGETVDTAVKRMGAFDQPRAVSIICQVLSALEFAHANGVIHRDIKPSNILIPQSGAIKVADFGIAHLETSELTIDGDILGTPSYMAPEQLSGGLVDHRADLYAAGLVLTEMLTGEKRFRNRSLSDLVRTMRSGAPPAPWSSYPNISPSLTAIIDRSLAFDPDHRYASAAEFSRAIEAANAASVPTDSGIRRDATIIAPRPAPAPPPASPTAGWSAETLDAVERDLTLFIGPVARVAVRRAAAGCTDIALLYEELAKLIDRPEHRAAFIAKARDRERGLTGGGTAGGRTAGGRTTAGATGGTGLSRQGTLASTDFSPDVLSRIEGSLAVHIGPIARVLVRKHLSRSSSVIDLCRELSLFIPDEEARSKFLRTQGIE